MSENAVRSSSGRDVQSSEQSIGTISHLCGLTTSESASSTPSCDQRSSSQIHDEPAYAASTCSQAPAACARSASSRTGSTDANDVVPTVATTAATSPSSSPSVRMPELVVGLDLAQLHAEHPRRLLDRRVRVLGADDDVAAR